MRCTVCTLVGAARLLAHRECGLLAMAAGVGLWFGCTASILCLGQRWLLPLLLVLVPGIHLGGVVVCCVPSATCFWAGCGETAFSVSHVCGDGQCYVWVFFL